MIDVGYCNDVVNDKNPDLINVQFTDLVELLKKPVKGSKDGAYFMRTTFIYESIRTRTENVSSTAKILILDADHTEGMPEEKDAPSPLKVHENLKQQNINHLIYRSYSHHLKGYGNRYRIVFVTDREYTNAELRPTVSHALGLCGEPIANVKENNSWSQPWYLPRTPKALGKDDFIYFEYTQGKPLPVKNLEPDWSSYRPKVCKGLSDGQISPINKYNEQNFITEELARRGDTQHGNKWLYHASTSKEPGISIKDNKMFSHHGSDPLNDGHAHDCFDVMMSTNGLNFNEAVKYAAQSTRAPDGRTVDDYNKTIHAQAAGASSLQPKKRFTFESISLLGESAKMEKQMLEDVFVLEGIALLGQNTVIYAGPNVGKTLIVLWLIIEAIKKGNFNPGNLMYINDDDTHKGLTQKLKLAEKYGFHMTASGYKGFKAVHLTEMMSDYVRFNEARGKIIILDTLKKFTDLMDKKTGSEFGNTTREFTAKGGTIISLAHVNKHKNAEGKSIKAGTSDIADDADCVYIGDVISNNFEKTIEFINDKNRGDIERKVSFTYDPDEKDYFKLLDSVKRIDPTKVDEIKSAEKDSEFFAENLTVINYIKELIYSGVNSQKEIIKQVNDMQGVSRNRTLKVLNYYTGNNPENGKIWRYVSRENNRYEYRLLEKYSA